jgi:hypothetical protein
MNYQISFMRPNGERSMLCMAVCNSDLDATIVAAKLMRPEFSHVEIWRGSDRVSMAHLVA